MTWVTAEQFAARLGVTGRAVRKAIAQGRLAEAVKPGRPVMVDDERAEAEWNRNTAPQLQRGKVAQRRQRQEQAAASPPPGGGRAAEDELPAAAGALSQAKAMAVRTAYQAKLLQLDFEERSGKLVSVEEMKRLRFESGRQVRDAVLRMGPQMIGEIAKAAGGLTPEQRAEVLLVIQRHQVQALEALADGTGRG